VKRSVIDARKGELAVTQEDILKRYSPGWQDCNPRQNDYKEHAALAMSGSLAPALASIPGSDSEAPDRLGECSDDISNFDNRTPEGSGLDLRDGDEQTTAAIEQCAADHVRKPCSADRIKKALDVAFRNTTEGTAENPLHLPRLSQWESTNIAIKANGKIVFIDPNDVIAVEANGNYVLLQRRSDSYLLRESIYVMAEILKPYGFVRVHRSVLVNSSFVEHIQSRPAGAYGLRTKGGKEYTVTRTYKKNLKSLAVAWIGTDIFLEE